MRKQLTVLFLTLLFSLVTSGQTHETTESGVWRVDAAGRYVRLEGSDGIVVDFLHDAADPSRASGVTVRVDTRALTVTYGNPGECAAAGLPRMTSVFDEAGRTSSVLADGLPLALIEHTGEGRVAKITVPGKLAWTAAAPPARREGMPAIRGASYDAVAEDLDLDFDVLTFEPSPTGMLTTVRDKQRRVVLYVVHTDRCDAGFAADGKPLFYDLPLVLFDGTFAPDSDVMESQAWETQHGTVPDHLVVSAGGAVGLYVEEPSSGAIKSLWTDRDKACKPPK